ncbi:BTB/POZ domain-containing protein [Rhizophagus clarus]|uniref:BTB/POZ domain-containing protein n=1 Tax=Rhizophagus clarus TaxID=94130 RepID=A0A8H3Q9Z4_9GLOM|nr:BTB/POZ domain-containing protein [Rhizophagus clarus]
MTFDYSKELINDYEKLIENDRGYDVIIYAGEDKVEIRAHSLILCIRSQYFRSAFSNKWANKEDGKFIFNKPNISPQILEIILRFIYCGKIDLTILQGPEILKLLIAVDELNVQTLIQCIQEYLINHKYEFLQQSSVEILANSYQYENFTDLWIYCLDKICEKPDVLFQSDEFINIKEPLLELLLNRDDFFSEEIIIWDNLIKWNFAQHPSIQKDAKKWNKEEIILMKGTLHRFIHLIRFYHITSSDFFLKVAFHMNSKEKLTMNIKPPRSPKYDSIIINSKHFAVFSS